MKKKAVIIAVAVAVAAVVVLLVIALPGRADKTEQALRYLKSAEREIDKEGTRPTYFALAMLYAAAGDSRSAERIACKTFTVEEQVRQGWGQPRVVKHEIDCLDPSQKLRVCRQILASHVRNGEPAEAFKAMLRAEEILAGDSYDISTLTVHTAVLLDRRGSKKSAASILERAEKLLAETRAKEEIKETARLGAEQVALELREEAESALKLDERSMNRNLARTAREQAEFGLFEDGLKTASAIFDPKQKAETHLEIALNQFAAGERGAARSLELAEAYAVEAEAGYLLEDIALCHAATGNAKAVRRLVSATGDREPHSEFVTALELLLMANRGDDKVVDKYVKREDSRFRGDLYIRAAAGALGRPDLLIKD